MGTTALRRWPSGTPDLRFSGPPALPEAGGPAQHDWTNPDHDTPDLGAAILIDDGLELLAEQECRALLASGVVGRVGVTAGALPVILPVNYAYVGDDVVFRTGVGTKLRAATDNAVIAFEVDAYDADNRSGWSVLVIGRAREVRDPAELASLERLGLAPWSDGDRSHYVRLRPELISGRRISPGSGT